MSYSSSSRIPLSAIHGLILAILAILLSATQAQAGTPVKNIVLVHGAFADATSWLSVIPLLEADGYHVVAVQNPLISFADEVAATKRIIALPTGHMSIMEDPGKVAAFINMAAMAASTK